MKPTSDTQPISAEPDELNEIERQAPEDMGGSKLAPEVSPGTAEITTWDVPPDTLTQRVPIMPLVRDETIAEQLVNAGNEEADLEQREAAEDEAGEAE